VVDEMDPSQAAIAAADARVPEWWHGNSY